MEVAAAIAWVAGAALALWTLRENRKTREMPVPRPRLLVRGPYAHVRQPAALAAVIAACGSALWCSSWRWAAAVPLVIVFAIARDRYLHEEEELAFRRYRASVPLLIPFTNGSRNKRDPDRAPVD